uniref:Uncharacterized protein n=1 Tax=Cannabis sativa TaxID=3483 RepID=A0A803QSV3_CANSA
MVGQLTFLKLLPVCKEAGERFKHTAGAFITRLFHQASSVATIGDPTELQNLLRTFLGLMKGHSNTRIDKEELRR